MPSFAPWMARAPWIPLALLAGACVDPGYAVHGRVHAPTALDGAVVRVMCPDGHQSNPLHVAADGTVADANMGVMPLGCELEITADGMRPERLKVADVCIVRERGRRCGDTRFDVTLVPAAPADGG